MPFNTPRLEDGNCQEENRCIHKRSQSLPSLRDITNNFRQRDRSNDSTSIERMPAADCSELPPERPIDLNNGGRENIRPESVTETQSDTVAPLDLQRERHTPTVQTCSNREPCEATGNELKPAPSMTGLSAKRKILSEEAIKCKKSHEEKQQEIEELKRLFQEIYEKWLDELKRQENRHFCRLESNEDTSSQTPRASTSRESIPLKSAHYHVSLDETKARLDEWEHNKNLQMERRRMQQQQEEQKRRELEEQRQQDTFKALEKWLAETLKRPKPAILQRSIYTLRTPISDNANANERQPESIGDH